MRCVSCVTRAAVSDVRKLCVVCSRVYRTNENTCPDDGAELVVEAVGDEHGRLGHVIGNYRLLRVLGEGGVGTVYAAEHIRLGRKMAIKVLHSDVVTDEMAQRFFNEARAVNEIRHPNIIEVEDFVTTPTGDHYMVMELLSGVDLRTVISRDGKLDPERVARIAAQIALALSAVHEHQILHRDLKPDNVFLEQKDGVEVAKLLDFGVAKFTEEEQGLTRAGMTMGTPQYMAPEMIISGRELEVGPTADLYALGMVMYEALTGEPAFNSTQLAHILRAQCFEPVPSIAEKRGSTIPVVIEAAVLKCLEKDPCDRFQDGRELAAALRTTEPVKVSGAVPVQRHAIRKVNASRRRAVMMLPALAMALAAIVIQFVPGSREEASAEPPRQAAPAHVEQPAPVPTPAPPAIALALSSNPDGAELFVRGGAVLGKAPIATTLPMSSKLVEIVARFPDGTEVVQTVVPDRALELVFEKPASVAITEAPLVKPVKKSGVRRLPADATTKPPTVDDRDATLDPFKQ